MITLTERVGREALIALAQYPSVALAIAEIVDNPFDYRNGRFLTVKVTMKKARSTLDILDYGGEGMDDRGLADWILWGTGHRHKETDIGQWHVGGKLAAIYLAESLEIVTRRAGSQSVFKFRDPHWGTRTSLYAGRPEMVGLAELRQYPELASLPGTIGFTLVRLRHLKPHRYEGEVLVSHLANTYSALLRENQCHMTVDGAQVDPISLPPSSVHEVTRIPATRLPGGTTVRGEIWVIDRDRLEHRRGLSILAGIRTTFNGRLITQGEQFAHNLSGRGQLQRLIGEVEIQHLKPNATKDNWDRDSPGWQDIETFMHERMQPLVAFLNQLSEVRQVSRDQRKRAERVRRQVTETIRRMALKGVVSGELLGDFDSQGGRKSPESREPRPHLEREGSEHVIKNRTEPPEEAVGRLLRRFSGGIPQITFDDLGRTARSQWRREADSFLIVINTSYPLYAELGETESYIAECVFRHLFGEPLEGEAPVLAQYKLRLDEALWEWQSLVEEG